MYHYNSVRVEYKVRKAEGEVDDHEERRTSCRILAHEGLERVHCWWQKGSAEAAGRTSCSHIAAAEVT